MTGSVDITGLDKAAVLAALFNAATPQGYGLLRADDGPEEMSLEDAQKLIDSSLYSVVPGMNNDRALEFDYIRGRPLKVNLSGSKFVSWLFDRDNGGLGLAQKAIDQLKGRA